MLFGNSYFIKNNAEFERGFTEVNPAPLFRRKINIKAAGETVLRICCLGYGYCYINGEKVSEDRFTAPFSNYNKTLWFNEYDVTSLINEGENTFAVICGNGFYNESIPTNWKFHEAAWRDNPKFILELVIDGEVILTSDNMWKSTLESPVYFNQLRMGEYYDSNISKNWFIPEFDDSLWNNAVIDNTPPKGILRKCECEPIRETKVFEPVKVLKLEENRCVYDFGQNMSGYARLKVKGKKDDIIKLRYSECIDENNQPVYYGMDKYYLEEGFQTDRFTCSGEEEIWSPRFAYHGFRYIEASGTDYCDKLDISAVFVHQDISRATSFHCSDEYIERLYNCGIISSWSNMFYILTDCPTREKFGWTNDAQSSCEQVMTNFKADKFFTKWHRDIKDAMKETGELPGIIPTGGWGYHWGNGPVSDGILFEIPYRIYLHTGDGNLLKDCFEYFEKYLDYLDSRKNADGLVEFGLHDWAAPGKADLVDVKFINAVLIYSFLKTTAISAKLSGNGKEEYYLKKAEEQKEFIKKMFISESGECVINEQCSVSMLIYYDVYDDIAPLKNQLKKLLEDNNYHLKCGMVGLRRLPYALDKCGLSDYFLKLLKAEEYPGYKVWMDEDATTLWEKWDINVNSDSKNHHMYSDFMSWLIKTPGGIRIDESKCGETEFVYTPVFLKELDFVEVTYNTYCGEIYASWKRENGKISIKLVKDENVKLSYNGERINSLDNVWEISEGEI